MFSSTNIFIRHVLYALIPGVFVSYYFFGFAILIQILLGVTAALVSEAVVLRFRQKLILPTLADGTAVLTAVLLAISIPSIAPWWLVIVGVSFAIIFGKQLYGGLGHNPFNPAMLGYAFLLIAYPLPMTQWQDSSFLSLAQSLQTIFVIDSIDALTAPTVLEKIQKINNLGASANNLLLLPAVWINLSFLLGGLYMLFRKIIFWQIPVSFLFGLIIMATLLHLINDKIYAHLSFHLFTGATMLGAFFIATDPITASTTPNGRLIYGFMIGVLIIIIREIGNYYPDGVAFAVLLANIFAPILDTYTKPKIFGKR